jgi:hypothetical protein
MAKKNCTYCEGKGKTNVLGEKAKCPYCYPPPGMIRTEYCDEYTRVTKYGVDGKILKVDEIKHGKRRKPDGMVNDSLRVQSKEEAS